MCEQLKRTLVLVHFHSPAEISQRMTNQCCELQATETDLQYYADCIQLHKFTQLESSMNLMNLLHMRKLCLIASIISVFFFFLNVIASFHRLRLLTDGMCSKIMEDR